MTNALQREKKKKGNGYHSRIQNAMCPNPKVLTQTRVYLEEKRGQFMLLLLFNLDLLLFSLTFQSSFPASRNC